jgi:hypothetical protein
VQIGEDVHQLGEKTFTCNVNLFLKGKNAEDALYLYACLQTWLALELIQSII